MLNNAALTDTYTYPNPSLKGLRRTSDPPGHLCLHPPAAVVLHHLLNKEILYVNKKNSVTTE